MKKNSSLMTKEEWVKETGEARIKPDHRIAFQDIFEKFAQGGGELFEVGCYPSTFSVFLAKRYKYRVNGIDFIPSYRERLIPDLLKQGISVGDFSEGDFLVFHPSSQYDLVCSFGFIEHFVDTEGIIVKHIDLVKKGGILIMTCPNFLGANYLLHKYLDGENLANHNLNAMDLILWRNVLTSHNMEILYHDYYGTFGFWGGKFMVGWKRPVAFSIDIVLRIFDSMIDRPSSKFSPYLISVSRRIG